MAPPAAAAPKAPTKTAYKLDISEATGAMLVVEDSFVKYLQTRLKVKRNGSLPGKLDSLIEVAGNGEGIVTVTVTTSENPKSKKYEPATAKRQLKYLSKKYLAKEKLHRFMYIVAPTKDAYRMKFLAAGGAEEEE